MNPPARERESRPGGNRAAITKNTGWRSENQSTNLDCRCRRCGAHLVAEASVAVELGPVCRRHEAEHPDSLGGVA